MGNPWGVLWGVQGLQVEGEVSEVKGFGKGLKAGSVANTKVIPEHWLPPFKPSPILGGSWVVISMAISPLISVITRVTLLIALLFVTNHEPPSIPKF